MFKCYQCKVKVKEKDRMFESMNLCIACGDKNSEERKPVSGFLWERPPQYVEDSIEADTNKALHKEMYGY